MIFDPTHGVRHVKIDSHAVSIGTISSVFKKNRSTEVFLHTYVYERLPPEPSGGLTGMCFRSQALFFFLFWASLCSLASFLAASVAAFAMWTEKNSIRVSLNSLRAGILSAA